MQLNRIACFCFLFAVLVLGSGCGAFKETVSYRTSTAFMHQDGHPTPEMRACKTPLRVAVTPFKDARKASLAGVDESGIAALGSVLVMPATGQERMTGPTEAGSAKAQYVHDDRRIFAIALWAELADSGCFAEVAFDPLDQAQYDLVFTGTIRRFGSLRKSAFVPLPLMLGFFVASGSAKNAALLEIDLIAQRPGVKKPVLKYGLQGHCGDCSENRLVDSAIISLRTGHADFVSRLRSYFGSRSTAYWNRYHEHRVAVRRAAMDPTLARLEQAERNEAGAVAEDLRGVIEARTRRLDAIAAVDQKRERAWAKTSKARVKAEIRATNAKMEEVHAKLVRAAVLSAVFSAGSAVVSGKVPSVSAQQRARDNAKTLSAILNHTSGSNGSLLTPRDRKLVERLVKDRAAAPARRQAALAAYRREMGSAEQIIERAREAGKEPTVEQPTASRTPAGPRRSR
ncbi:MAG: hypothetical protein IPI67_40210 [Myxococcales bacterium]|nr:hypothetical protein [Myxococcales bacterium]